MIFICTNRRYSGSFSSILVFITFTSFWNYGDGVGLHREGNDYCYSDPECGPDSDSWGDTCQTGLRQSPISLPHRPHLLPDVTALHLGSYRGDAFRMQNNGRTVHIEFLEQPNHGHGPRPQNHRPNHLNFVQNGFPIHAQMPFPFLGRYNREESSAYYKFDSAHFHWGNRDDVGSEHCFEDRCFSMELHLVHHLSNYDSMSEALESGDSNALAVIAVMLDVTPAAGHGNPVLAPIVNNIFQIEESSHDEHVYINQPLDFSPLLATTSKPFVYSYKGSLTTPDCDEQVNWFVFKKPIAISHRDVHAFRFLRDSKGNLLRENHRPIQNRNGRAIFLSAVKPI
ncbi:unnamed protein product [Orchesella dallaii]|uniref:carbonic anhydrase n=1 Tax=Orchesella dallaii TaxID=48710 RepID=A0ABP1PQX9_9HEXA